MKNKMTAVEWLVENSGLKDNLLWKEVIEQAKKWRRSRVFINYLLGFKNGIKMNMAVNM